MHQRTCDTFPEHTFYCACASHPVQWALWDNWRKMSITWCRAWMKVSQISRILETVRSKNILLITHRLPSVTAMPIDEFINPKGGCCTVLASHEQMSTFGGFWEAPQIGAKAWNVYNLCSFNRSHCVVNQNGNWMETAINKNQICGVLLETANLTLWICSK